MGDYGLKVTQDGYAVTTALDKQLVFSSEFNSLKISEEVSDSLTINDSANAELVSAHGLGYAPSHMVFTKLLTYGGSSYWVGDGMGVFALPIYDPSQSSTDGSLLGDLSYHMTYSDGTNLRTEVDNYSGGQKTYDIYQFILIEDNS